MFGACHTCKGCPLNRDGKVVFFVFFYVSCVYFLLLFIVSFYFREVFFFFLSFLCFILICACSNYCTSDFVTCFWLFCIFVFFYFYVSKHSHNLICS